MAILTTSQRLCAALCYLGVGFIWCLLDEEMRRRQFLKFHIRQAIVFLLAVIILQVFMALLFFIPYIWTLLLLFLLVIGVAGILNALQGKKKALPLIGEYVEYLEL